MMRVLAITFTPVLSRIPFLSLSLLPAELVCLRPRPSGLYAPIAPAALILRKVLPPIGLVAIGSIELDSGGCLATGRRMEILVPRPVLLRSTDLFPILPPIPDPLLTPLPDPFLG